MKQAVSLSDCLPFKSQTKFILCRVSSSSSFFALKKGIGSSAIILYIKKLGLRDEEEL